MKKVENRRAVNIVVFVIVICIFAIATAYLFPIIKSISTPEGQLLFKEKIRHSGAWGVLMLFSLEVAQIFLAVIPGEPLELLAGMCFGTLGGTIFITVSVLITTTIIVLLVRKYGRKFVYDSFKKEKVDKLENSKILKDPKKVELIMIILFLIPGTPKDLLTYIGGLLPIRPIRFILISTFARFPSVITSCIAGANLVDGNIHITIIAFVVTFLITLAMLLLIHFFDKNNETKDTLKALK